jgi:hypothetical protein
MAYDRTLDVVSVKTEVFADDKTAVSISVHSYNGGESKVQLSREYIKRDGTRSFRKLGRLTLVEATAVAEAMPKVLLEVAEVKD